MRIILFNDLLKFESFIWKIHCNDFVFKRMLVFLACIKNCVWTFNQSTKPLTIKEDPKIQQPIKNQIHSAQTSNMEPIIDSDDEEPVVAEDGVVHV